MALDFDTLTHLKRSHPAWRLMTADNGPMIAAFLDREFREATIRMIPETELCLHLDDFIHALAADHEEDLFPKSAEEYLSDWTHESRGWLRKFYPIDSDLPHYDLTPEAEKALSWMEQLSGKRFLGTEGRLNLCFELLRQIVHGKEENLELRLKELKNRKKAIDDEITRLKAGEVSVLSDRELRERFSQFSLTARELLGDFRAVEQNFIELDRSIREQIALWDGEKSEMLHQILDRHDSIQDSDEGQSFRAFWDFLMSPASQDELQQLLDRVFCISELGEYLEDTRLRRVHFDWIQAGDQTQRRIAQLSAQLRRYLDDKVLQEQRRITELLNTIEKTAVSVRENPPGAEWSLPLAGMRPDITLPMEYPLFSPPIPLVLDSVVPEAGEEELDLSLLLNQITVDRQRLEQAIGACLATEAQISLASLLARFPLEQGLSELIAYFQIASERPEHLVEESVHESFDWYDAETALLRRARVPLILFCRKQP